MIHLLLLLHVILMGMRMYMSMMQDLELLDKGIIQNVRNLLGNILIMIHRIVNILIVVSMVNINLKLMEILFMQLVEFRVW